MPRNAEEEDWDSDQEADFSDSDEDETIPCPYCGQPVHEDSQRCPHCATYISEEDAPSGKPTWLVLGVVLCLAIVAMWVLSNW